jgi:hypothetical protein
MCIKFPDKPKSFKELTAKEYFNLLIALVMTVFICLGIAFTELLLGGNIMFNPKVYLPTSPTKRELRQINWIKSTINKLRFEQYNK